MSERKYPQRKIDEIDVLEAMVKESNAIYLADYLGLDVEKMTELRDKFFEKDAKIYVAKNTLMKLALNNNGINDLDPFLNGPNIFAFGGKDPVAPAKIIFDFAKIHELPAIKSCLFEGVLYGPDKVAAIKDLPTRDEAIAALIGQVQAPVSNFVGLLNEIVRSFLGVIDAIIQEKGGETA